MRKLRWNWLVWLAHFLGKLSGQGGAPQGDSAPDLAWVIGSYPLLFVVPFSTTGKWIVGIVAEVVLLFALMQWLGIRRIRKGNMVPEPGR